MKSQVLFFGLCLATSNLVAQAGLPTVRPLWDTTTTPACNYMNLPSSYPRSPVGIEHLTWSTDLQVVGDTVYGGVRRLNLVGPAGNTLLLYGSTGALGEFDSPWSYIPRRVLVGKDTTSMSCNDCLYISTRCWTHVGERLVFTAAGQDGGWGNTDYAFLAALPLGDDMWLVIWSSGASAVVPQVGYKLLQSIRFN